MKKAFILIELIIVVVIIAILAVIAMMQYTRAVEKGYTAEAKTILGSLRNLQISYNREYDSYVVNPNDLDSTVPNDSCDAEHYFRYSCADNGTCTATRCTTATPGKQPDGDSAYWITLTVDGAWDQGVQTPPPTPPPDTGGGGGGGGGKCRRKKC